MVERCRRLFNMTDDKLAHFSSFIERLIDNTVTIILLFYTKQSVAFLTTDVACWQKQVDNGVVV
ncbi:hypothetical protein T01_2175 [Trichinella spiralis]|uniref:Uncharacterized protein n=1 Tax=Trichinella spiralis TaxID=6334 RepID=A0A0V1BEA7_TRISP|nr:hypothetical protein T01_2175 [Trichinella spiralis]